MHQENSIYWVDRFDHILSEDEYVVQELVSFVDVKSNLILLEQYQGIEEKLKSFLKELTSSINPMIDNLELKAYRKGNLDFYKGILLEDWKNNILNSLKKSNSYKTIIKIGSIEELDFYLELALREIIDLRVKIDKTIFTIGYDLKILIQFVDKSFLKDIIEINGLFLLNVNPNELNEDLWNN